MAFCDLSILTKSSKKHGLSQGHIHAMIQFKTFGKARIDFLIDNQSQREVELHNRKVKENRCSIFCLKARIGISWPG